MYKRQTLGLKNSASLDEVKRAYRILARRHHPDINGRADAGERFKEIQEAYNTLRDPEKKKLYDATAEAFLKQQFNQKLKSYSKYAESSARSKEPPKESFKSKVESAWEEAPFNVPLDPFKDLSSLINQGRSFSLKSYDWLKDKGKDFKERFQRASKTKVSIVEVSVTIEESLKGVRKKVEFVEPEGTKKVSIVIPPGVRDGSVIRLRNKSNKNEDLIIVVRLAHHPFLSIKAKGLIMEIPVTVSEALYGAQIKVPGVEDSILVKIPSQSQSGSEVRIEGQGIQGRDGKRGDLFIKVMIMTPPDPNAALLKEKTDELNKYYEKDVRAQLPTTLL